MPMRNAEPYVEAAIRSVLAEHSVDLELVVVDDGSTDRSREIVSSVHDQRIRIIDGPSNGFALAFNTGLAACKGDIFMPCDADDLYEQGRIARQVEWLDAHPEFDALAGRFSKMDKSGRLVSAAGNSSSGWQEITHELTQGITRTSWCTFAYRRVIIDSIGGLRPYFETSPDLDFQFRISGRHRVAFDPVNTYFYRLHGESITHTQPNARRIFFEETAREFQRQRLETGIDELEKGHPPSPPFAVSEKPNSVTHQIQGMLIGQSWRFLNDGKFWPAIIYSLRAITSDPLKIGAWRNFLLVALRGISRGRR